MCRYLTVLQGDQNRPEGVRRHQSTQNFHRDDYNRLKRVYGHQPTDTRPDPTETKRGT